MIKTFISIISIFLLLGCQDIKQPEAPENLIPKDKMVAVLTDLYLNKAARNKSNRVVRQKGIKLDSFLYAKHQIDSLQFVESHAFYTLNINSYKELFTQVEANLQVLKKEVDSMQKEKGKALQETTKRRADSIKKNKSQRKLIDAVQSEEDSLPLK